MIFLGMSKKIIQKSEQIKKQSKRLKTPLMVEPNFSKYLTEKDYDESQLHVNKQRTLERTLTNFKTYKYLAENKLLDQDYKNQLFSSSMIDSFFQSFQFYDKENTEVEEQNKLHIAIDGIERGISYLQSRYTETSLVYKQVEEFKDLLKMLIHITERKSEDKKAIEFYKTRNLQTLPPNLQGDERLYVVMCRICWNYYSDQDKKQAISHIRHSKHCLYEKTQISRCIEVIPPKNLKEKT